MTDTKNIAREAAETEKDGGENTTALLIGEEYAPAITAAEAEALKPIQKRLMERYIANKDAPPAQWLPSALKEELPDKTDAEAAEMSAEIIHALEISEEKKESLNAALKNGRSRESWFAGEISKATSFMSARQSAEYLQTLDSAVSSANEALRRTITTRAGLVSQNPNLDGFIAEQYHAQTFNLNAAARGSEYRAEVPVPDGRFGKNSVDIMIKDGAGKIARKFQSKYCKDAEATLDAFNHGDYRGSGKLVSSDQLEDVSRVTKATDRIAAPDGTTSNPLAKSGAERMRDEARSGKWNDLNWNEYKTKDIAAGMGKQVGQSVIMGAAVGAGFSVAQKLWEGEEIDGAEIVETAVKSGADFGVKAAAAAALKAGAEKGILTFIPKGTPAGTIANVAFVAVENVKVLGEIADGELSPVEGLEKMERVTVSTVAGIAASVEAGAAAALALAPVLGPLAPVAGFVAGTVAYMAGSAVAEAVVSAAQKVRRVAVDTVKTVCEGAKSIVSGVSNFVGSIFGW